MEECLSYFRAALHRPEQVPVWDDWWAAHEVLVPSSFTSVDYQRLKVRRLIGARDLLTRLGALDDPQPPVRLDAAFIDSIRAVPWFARCGHECRVALPFEMARVADWNEAQATCLGNHWNDVRLEAQNGLTVFLHINCRIRYQRCSDIVAAADAACTLELRENVWQPLCQRNGLADSVSRVIQRDMLGAVLEHEFGDCSGRPAFALHLFKLYRAGHFPCGWRGKWPAGQLLVL